MDQKRNEREIRKHFDLNEIENTKYQKLWNIAKMALSGKFI